MAMAPEAGPNFLSGNKQRLPFTIAQAALAMTAAILSGHRGPGWGDTGARAARLSSVSCSEGCRGVGEAASEGQSRRGCGLGGPFLALLVPCWRHSGQPPARTWLREPSACPTCPGGQHKGSGPSHCERHHSPASDSFRHSGWRIVM